MFWKTKTYILSGEYRFCLFLFSPLSFCAQLLCVVLTTSFPTSSLFSHHRQKDGWSCNPAQVLKSNKRRLFYLIQVNFRTDAWISYQLMEMDYQLAHISLLVIITLCICCAYPFMKMGHDCLINMSKYCMIQLWLWCNYILSFWQLQDSHNLRVRPHPLKGN